MSERTYSGPQDPARFHRDGSDIRLVMPDGHEHGIPFDAGKLSMIAGGSESDGGYGTFRSVFTAESERLGVPVAGLKIFKPVQDIAGAEMALRVCEEEYSILCDIGGEGGHAPVPYMLGVYDMSSSSRPFGSGVKYPAIMMEHLDGKHLLSQEMRDGTLFGGYAGAQPTGEKVARILLEIAKALKTCHDKVLSDGTVGIVHRDVSPRNIFIIVSEDGSEIIRATLIDFGQSTRLQSRVSTRGRPGTMAFSGPEMNIDAKQITCPDGETLYSKRNDPTVDVWSFGAIAYYIRTNGKVPHEARLQDSRFGGELQVKKNFTLGLLDVIQGASEMDVMLDALIRDCTQFYPQERPSGMDEVIERLEAALELERRNAGYDPIGIATPPPMKKPGRDTPPPVHVAADAPDDGDGDDGAAMRQAMQEFAEEFEISANEAYEMMAKMGYGYGEYKAFLRGAKWMMIASLVSKKLGLVQDRVIDLLPLGDDIAPGSYEDELAKWMEVFEGLTDRDDPLGQHSKPQENTPPPTAKTAPKTYTVTYEDGVGGKVFPNMEFVVEEGTKTPVFNPDITEHDGLSAAGWSREVAETVHENAVYTMRWAKEQVSDIKGQVEEKVKRSWGTEKPSLVAAAVSGLLLIGAVADFIMGGALL